MEWQPHSDQTMVFIDESGDPNLDVTKSGVSDWYTIAAVLVRWNDAEALRSQLERVRSTHFGSGEIKSSKVGRNTARRLQVLADLEKLGAKYITFSVDKRRAADIKGLKYRESFYKYVTRLLYVDLHRTYQILQVVADRFGRDQFMASYEPYLQRQVKQTSLLSAVNITFANTDDDIRVQMADFIAGTVRRLTAGDDRESAKEISSLLSSMRINEIEWPEAGRWRDELGPELSEGGFDRRIAAGARVLAEHFNEEHAAMVEDELMPTRLHVLRHLLNAQRATPYAWIATDAIRDELLSSYGVHIEAQQLRQAVIAYMRDRDVPICSSGSGYKLPVCPVDLSVFAERVRSNIEPQVERLAKMAQMLARWTDGEVQLLDDSKFQALLAVHNSKRSSGD